MDDSLNDLDYLNDIRDAQMLYRAPRRQFERFDLLEYYDENEFVERFRFTKTKTEIRRLCGGGGGATNKAQTRD